MTQLDVRPVYAGRHRGQARPVIAVTEHLTMVEGLWRQVSVASGTAWWSVDGNRWQAGAVVTGAHAAV